MLSYVCENKMRDVVYVIDSAAYNLNNEKDQRLYSYSNRMDDDAKMVKNEHLPDSARIGDSDEEDSI